MRDLARDFRLLTSPLRLVPDFAIVGEAKCGTTSLYRYLLQSPAVLGADRKEPKNFIDYPDSLFYCRSHYPTRAARRMRRMRLGRRVVAGEATAEYFSHPGMAERLLRLLPRIKIVVLLRNPVDRAYSDYQMLSRLGVTDLSFDEVVDRSLEWLETPALSDLVDAALRSEHFYLRFVARGLYVRTLRQLVRRPSCIPDPGVEERGPVRTTRRRRRGRMPVSRSGTFCCTGCDTETRRKLRLRHGQ